MRSTLRRSIWRIALVLTLVAIASATASAQMVHSGTGQSGVGDGFNERIGTTWGGHSPGWFANFGAGPPGVAAPFADGGGGGGLSGGFGFGGGGGGFSGGLGFGASQGSTRSIGGTSGSITSLNGTQGYLFSGTLTPFVTEFTPVVGSGAPAKYVSPLRAKLHMVGGMQGVRTVPSALPQNASAGDTAKVPKVTVTSSTSGGARGSSAQRGDLSVAAIRQAQSAVVVRRDAELESLVSAAKAVEASGDARAAANAYCKAAAAAEGEQRDLLLQKARMLRKPKE